MTQPPIDQNELLKKLEEYDLVTAPNALKPWTDDKVSFWTLMILGGVCAVAGCLWYLSVTFGQAGFIAGILAILTSVMAFFAIRWAWASCASTADEDRHENL